MTNALALLMRVIGVEKGDEILCCSFNCLSSTSAIDNVGAKTVWVDIKDDYPEMCIQDCENKITKRPRQYFYITLLAILVELKILKNSAENII